jgi:hypothetical protein
MIRWVIYSKDSDHKATPLFYEIYKERNLRYVFLMQSIIMVKYVKGSLFSVCFEFQVRSAEFRVSKKGMLEGIS